MNDRDYVEAEELSKTLSLLQEYTNKLRKVCHAKLFRDTWLNVLLITIVVSFSVTTMWYIFPNIGSGVNPLLDNKFSSQFIIYAFIVLGGAAIIRQTFFITGKRNRIEAEELANILMKLIKICSQHQEHSRNRLGTDIEFSLRLAEAEAIFHTYTDTFKSKRYDKV